MTFGFSIPDNRPVLIAGPTASGKSALAVALADRAPSVIVNADAFQIYANWRVLTARPSIQDEARHPHALYGHIAGDVGYSAGEWLREVAPLLEGPRRPIIVGGTGLYFSALTQGLAEIPPTPPDVRAEADALRRDVGIEALLANLDTDTLARVDIQNPMRVQRAWEVQRTTGRGLAAWHAETPPPLLPLNACTPILVNADTSWLNTRIAQRFDHMLEIGALEEARANLPGWNPAHPSSRAIGAAELIAHLQGDATLERARDAATIATRQYAKRQRTWYRARMQNWHSMDAEFLASADFA